MNPKQQHIYNYGSEKIPMIKFPDEGRLKATRLATKFRKQYFKQHGKDSSNAKVHEHLRTFGFKHSVCDFATCMG